MRNVYAAVLMGALMVSPTLGQAEPSLANGKPAGVKNAQLSGNPILVIALVGAVGLGIGLAVSNGSDNPAITPASTPTST